MLQRQSAEREAGAGVGQPAGDDRVSRRHRHTDALEPVHHSVRGMKAARRDDGTIIPMVAMCMVALITIWPIVIALGATRTPRRDPRSAADAGATAGAFAVPSTTPITICTDALTYAFQSIGGTQPS